tara:strand:- start:39 stop:266 length:228 start_codon:yes stop_codon:yes gene_type:complete
MTKKLYTSDEDKMMQDKSLIGSEPAIMTKDPMKNKKELCEELIIIINANKNNMYCDEHQLADMIHKTFKNYDIWF